MSRSGAAYLASGQSMAPIMESGKYSGGVPLLAPTTGIFGEGNESGMPFPASRPVTIATVGLEITVPGSAGALIHLGVRGADSTGYSAGLLADLGVLDGTAVAGFYEITVNLAVPGGMLWLTATNQGGAGTRPTVRQINVGIPTVAANNGLTLTQQANVVGATVNTGVAGALPATSQPFPGALSRVPFLVVKVA